MFDNIPDSLAVIPWFLAYFVLGLLLLAVFLRIYMWLTPHDELALIKDNNTAAAVALCGALLGFALPLAAAIAGALDLPTCALWGLIALVVQSLTFVVMRALLSHLPERIAKGEMASAILTAGISVVVGLVNAASMSY